MIMMKMFKMFTIMIIINMIMIEMFKMVMIKMITNMIIIKMFKMMIAPGQLLQFVKSKMIMI